MSNEQRWGFKNYTVAFGAKVVDPARIRFERPEDWTDEEWRAFVADITEFVESGAEEAS